MKNRIKILNYVTNRTLCYSKNISIQDNGIFGVAGDITATGSGHSPGRENTTLGQFSASAS